MYNRGLYTEELVNKTIEWYLSNNIAFFRKAHIPISINSKFCKKSFSGILKEKADIDYYGVFDGKYVSFEVKETEKESFNLSQIKEHQLNILLKISEFGAISFIILNFVNIQDSTWIINGKELKKLIDQKIKIIHHNSISEYAINLPLEYPGVIDWLKALNLRKN